MPKHNNLFTRDDKTGKLKIPKFDKEKAVLNFVEIDKLIHNHSNELLMLTIRLEDIEVELQEIRRKEDG